MPLKGDTPRNNIRKRLVYERYGALHALVLMGSWSEGQTREGKLFPLWKIWTHARKVQVQGCDLQVFSENRAHCKDVSRAEGEQGP